jgi:hypothetical protein
VDINGVHEGNWARTPYSSTKGRIVAASRDEAFDATTDHGHSYDWARDLIEEFPEHFGANDVTKKVRSV